MRTTLTLDPDVALLVQEAMGRTRRSLKEVVNASLRYALSPGSGEQAPPFQVEPHEARLVGAQDLRGYNRLADQLEDRVLLAAEPRGPR